MREDITFKKLGEVCDFQNGFAFKSKTFTKSGVPVIRIGDIQNERVDTSEIVYVNPDAYKKDLSRYEIVKNDLLIAMSGATTGKIGFVEEDQRFLLNQRVGKFEPKKDLDKRYLFYYLSTKVEESLAISAGSAQPNLSTKQIKNFKIPIPPLSEQMRIVAILDEAFEAIDQAKSNIERNIENAEELFQSKLNEIFSQRGEGWEEKKLKDITSKIGSGATPRGGRKNYKESGISLIRSLNVYDEGFEKEKLAFIDNKQADKLSNVELFKGDVLLNITGASVARCCVVPEDFLPARVNQHVSIIRLKEGIMDENFLHYLLISKKYKDKLLGIGEQGATRQAITKSQIQDFEVSYPNEITTQKRIVRTLDGYRDRSNALRKLYISKLESLEELKKSILQKAFSGKLTAEEEMAA